MSSITQENQVVYVEPNAMDDVTSYSTGSGKVNKSVDLEDLCISVDLDVEVKGKTYSKSSNGSNSNIKLSWQSSKDGEVVRFMSGTKIPTGIKKDGHVNSLTTNYTDCYLYDVISEGTCEMFGIKSIDISYNNFMVPEVTIQFVDVRGVSLFAQEELRHNISRNGMDGIANNSVEGSFFKCFFTFPYPKFTLRVKGLYGDMVSYELTCSDFRSSFDSNTGNFNVTAKFIGYQFSFFNDVMVNGLIAAPYSDYLGRKYWDDNNGSRFTVTNSVGMDGPMMRLGELCRDYMKVKKDLADKIERDGIDETIKSELGIDTPKSIGDSETIKKLKEGYQTCIEMLRSKESMLKGKYDTVIHPNGTNSYIYVIDCKGWLGSTDKPDFINDIMSAFEKFGKLIDENYNAVGGLKKWVAEEGHHFVFREVGDYGDVYGDKDTIDKSKISEDVLRKELTKYLSDKSRDWKDGWKDGYGSVFFVYEDFGLKDTLGVSVNTVSTETENNARKIQEKAEEKIIRKKLEEAIGFPPTVENITKVIMAHFETYVYCISRCASNIISSNRTANSLGITVEDFPDIIGNSPSDMASSNVEVAPFPEVTEKVTLDNVPKNESSWIGKFGGADKFEEVSLIEGILSGIEHLTEDMNKYVSVTEQSSSNTTNCSVKNAISFTDIFLTDNENPFGNVRLDSVDDVFARFCVRAFTVIGAQKLNENVNAKTLGMLDAETFCDRYQNDSKIGRLSNAINGITTTGVIRFVNSGTERLDKSARSNPWYRMKQLVQPYGDTSYLYVGSFSKTGHIIPVKDWSWKEWGYSYETGSGLTTSKIDKFILTETATIKGSKGVYVDDSNSMNVKIMESPLTYMNNVYTSLCASQYVDETIKNRFKCLVFDKDSYLNNNNIPIYDTNDKKIKLIKDAIAYNQYGGVENADGLTFARYEDSTYASFFDRKYNSKTSDYEKSAYFLVNIMGDSSSDWLMVGSANSPHFAYAYKLRILQIGVDCWQRGCDGRLFRRGIERRLANYFKTWTENSFKSIESIYGLNLKKGVTYDDFIDHVKGYSGAELEKRIREKVSDWGTFNMAYEVKSADYGNIRFNYKSCEAMSKAMVDLLQITAICFTTRFNNDTHYANDSLMIKTSQLSGYLDGVLTVLKEKLSKSDQGGTDGSDETIISNDNEDIKVGLYNYIKMLYDKWIASDLDNSNYKMESMFYDEDRSFHFVDSAYNKIGNSMYLNLGVLVDTLMASQFKNGYSMLSMMSEMYSLNKFQFMCLQNFADLSDPTTMQRMFKPIPYIDVTQPANHPDFVVLYPYEASSHLDVEGADYPDDTFYLNDKTTWPVMISEKNSSNGYSIPAFGVTYGQQYQNYFKDIQVDMNIPMATEQSIKAKFLVCGANSEDLDNGPREATIGQDLYTIYSNNSYTCTVTMLGCAWVQPMMYFVLNNIPMFRGSYLIYNVSHQIEPGNMTTTFKGMRMSKYSTRSVRSYIYGETIDSTCGGNPSESSTARVANIGNDCNYAYMNPLCPNATDIDVSTPTNASAAAYCAATYNALRKVIGNNGAMGVCANIYQESGFDPYMLIIDGNNQNDKNPYHCAGGGLCSFRGVDINGNNGGKAVELFMYAYKCSKVEAISKLRSLTAKVEPYWHGVVCSTRTRKEIRSSGLRFPIKFDVQVRHICEIASKMNGLKIAQNPSDAADIWMNDYENPMDKTSGLRWRMHGKKVKDAIASSQQSLTVDTSDKASKSYTNWDYMHGLEQSVQYSLRCSEYYSNAKLSIKKGAGRWAKYNATGKDNVTNAVFDCILNTYWKWVDYIYWDVGSGSMNSDASSIIVHIVSTPPKRQTIAITSNHDISSNSAGTLPRISEKDINQSMRMSLIKYFRSRGITRASEAKALFKQLVCISDSSVEELFELKKSSNDSLVQQCITLSGQYVETCISSGDLKNGNFSGKVSNQKMKLILSNVASLSSSSFGRNARQKGHRSVKVCDGKYANEWELQRNEYNGVCTSGPTTWYKRAGISLTWWGDVRGVVTYENSKRFLMSCGMVPIWHGTIDELNSYGDLKPGDIATLYKGESGRQHGMMWTGSDWRSDCIQNNAKVYSSSNQGKYAAVLWRNPKLQ